MHGDVGTHRDCDVLPARMRAFPNFLTDRCSVAGVVPVYECLVKVAILPPCSLGWDHSDHHRQPFSQFVCSFAVFLCSVLSLSSLCVNVCMWVGVEWGGGGGAG